MRFLITSILSALVKCFNELLPLAWISFFDFTSRYFFLHRFNDSLTILLSEIERRKKNVCVHRHTMCVVAVIVCCWNISHISNEVRKKAQEPIRTLNVYLFFSYIFSFCCSCDVFRSSERICVWMINQMSITVIRPDSRSEYHKMNF